MKRLEFDPDVTRRDDAPYWAAAMVLALRAGNAKRIADTRRNLKRLGYAVDVASGLKRKAVRDDR